MEKQRQTNTSTDTKSQRRIENLGNMFSVFQNNVHIEFVKDSVRYAADFAMHRMVVYNNEASGFACMQIDGCLKTVKLTVFPESFTFVIQDGSNTEKSYEKSYRKRRVKRDIGFYVKEMRMVA